MLYCSMKASHYSKALTQMHIRQGCKDELSTGKTNIRGRDSAASNSITDVTQIIHENLKEKINLALKNQCPQVINSLSDILHTARNGPPCKTLPDVFTQHQQSKYLSSIEILICNLCTTTICETRHCHDLCCKQQSQMVFVETVPES